MKLYKTTLWLVLSLINTGCSLPIRYSSESEAIKIVAFNDFHGQLESPGNLSQSKSLSSLTPVGGVDWMAGYIDHLKNQNPNTIVVSAGDLIGASPFVSALFHDEATIEAMNRLGLDFNAVGNHELDEGTDELKRMQNGGCHSIDDHDHTCRGSDAGTPVPFEGAHFMFLAANVIETQTGATLFPAFAIRKIDDIAIGFIGITLKEAKTIVSPHSVKGLTFLDEAQTINALIPALREQGVEAIVILIHQGGTVPAPLSVASINQCDGGLAHSPIQKIVNQLHDAVDLVISGHTHQAYNCQIPNQAGRNIPVTSADAQGRLLTDIDLLIDRSTGDVTRIAANNIVVDRNTPNVTPDVDIKKLVEGYKAIAQEQANKIIGTISTSISRTANFAGESALGDVIADAHLAATQNALFRHPVAAFTNSGDIRADLSYESSETGEGNGKVTFAEAFAVHPFRGKLVVMTLTGAQIHTLLEQQFTGCTEAYPPDAPPNGQPKNRVLQVSNGFSYQWQQTNMPCVNVDPASISINGIPLDTNARYRITVNDFLADGGDQFYILRQGTDRIEGETDLQALEKYLGKHPFVSPGKQDRIIRLK